MTTMIIALTVALTGITATASADHDTVTHTIDEAEENIDDNVIDKTRDNDYTGFDCYRVGGSSPEFCIR